MTINELKQCEVVGFFDGAFFRSVGWENGLILRTPKNERVMMTHAEIRKILQTR